MTVPTLPAVSEAMREAVARCECGAEIDPNAVFEPGVCDPCSARRFNEEAAAHRNLAPPPIPVRGRFYMICCEHCDWVGSSEQCGTDAGQDDSDVSCPVCCQAMLCEEPGEADTAKHGQAVFDRIESQASEIARLTERLRTSNRERNEAIETAAIAHAAHAAAEAEAEDLLAGIQTVVAARDAAEAETARLRAALEDADNRAIARILAMSDEEVLSGVSPEKLAALMAERDAACARARQGFVIRDCACCSDQPMIPPDCPACKGRGGFGPYPLGAALTSQEKTDV
jgi:hypothetical protein